MPRWLQIALSLIAFAAIMLALRWVLLETLPGMMTWLAAQIGAGTVLAITLSITALCGLLGYLGHRRQAQRDGADG